MHKENPLQKVLRLAQVQSFERRSPRGRIERVRSFVRGIEDQRLPGEEDALRGKAVPGNGNWAYQRAEESQKAHDTAHNTASKTAKATAARDAAATHLRDDHKVKPAADAVKQHTDLHDNGKAAGHWHSAESDFRMQTNSMTPDQAAKVKVPKNFLDAGGLV